MSRKGSITLRKWGQLCTFQKDGDKLPRKKKKALLGKRLGKQNIGNRIENWIKGVDRIDFCPKCGCPFMYSTGNMAEYPEVWENFYCLRCRAMVGAADNSPFQHVLEWIWIDKGFEATFDNPPKPIEKHYFEPSKEFLSGDSDLPF